MTTHLSGSVAVIRSGMWEKRCRHPGQCIAPACGDFCYEIRDTQDGWDWPNPHPLQESDEQDERAS